MAIYESWQTDLARRLWIEERFHPSSFEKNFYDAALKTMRYIGSYIRLDKSLKSDLHECRSFVNEILE